MSTETPTWRMEDAWEVIRVGKLIGRTRFVVHMDYWYWVVTGAPAANAGTTSKREEAKQFVERAIARLSAPQENPDPKRATLRFKAGDIVEATAKVWRADGNSHLDIGDRATVRASYRRGPDSPWMAGLEIKGRLPMSDIICFEDGPLKLVPQEGDESPATQSV